MSKTTHAARRWDTVEYQQILSAKYDSGDIVVEFADGGQARVPASVLLGGDAVTQDWSNLRVEEFHVVASSPDGDIEIPWDVIRVHSDPEFDAHWASMVGDTAPEALVIWFSTDGGRSPMVRIAGGPASVTVCPSG